MQYFVTSARTGQGVEAAFRDLVCRVVVGDMYDARRAQAAQRLACARVLGNGLGWSKKREVV